MTATATERLVREALAYAARGWPVFPCRPRAKEPITPHGFKDATTDPDQIRRWWTKTLAANVAVKTGNGLVVIDCDMRPGINGVDTLADWEREHGELPDTVCQLTGGGGMQYFFTYPKGVEHIRCRASIADGIDVKADGGYVILPPSVHPSGREYVWQIDDEPESRPLATLPDWLLAKIVKNDAPKSPDGGNGQLIQEKHRNCTLTSLAGTMRQRGMGVDAIRAALLAENANRCKTPLPDDEVSRIADSVSRYEPTAPAKSDKLKRGTLIDSLAKAILTGDHFARDAGGKLYVFRNGTYHQRGELRIKQCVKALLDQWKKIGQWSSHIAGEVVEFVAVDAPELWDRPPMDTVNVANGLLDVNTRTLRPHDPKFLSPIQIPVEFNPKARCPKWDKFIAEVFPEDARNVAYQIPALLMLPVTAHQVAILLIGEGSNGKSRYLVALSAFIGRKNIAGVSLHRLESDRFAVARLVGKLANVFADLPSEHLASTSTFKTLTGGDSLGAEYKYRDGFEFTPHARLIFSANHPPRCHDSSDGFFRRWAVIPFDRTFTGEKMIPADKLDAMLADPVELSGVLNKALDVLPGVLDHGISRTPTMDAAWAEFREVTGPVSVWLDRCTFEGAYAVVLKKILLGEYNAYAAQRGLPTLTRTAFGLAIKRLRPNVREAQRTVGGKVRWVYTGIGLASDDTDGG